MPVGHRPPREARTGRNVALRQTLSPISHFPGTGSLGLAIAAAVLASGCGDSLTAPTDIPTNPDRRPTTVVVTPPRLATTGGSLERFAVEVVDITGERTAAASVRWSTTDPSIAIVDSAGNVWTFARGTAVAVADFPGDLIGVGQNYDPSVTRTPITVRTPQDNLPATVDDLSVVSTSDTSVTLSFTEVDDGSGSAATYLVRQQVAPLDWGLATDVSRGTCSTPVTGMSVGATRTCTVEGLLSDVRYQFQLVAYRGIYPTDMIHGDLSNVVPGRTTAEPDSTLEPGATDRPVPTDQPEPGPEPVSPDGSAGHPNEPAGLSPIAWVTFSDSVNAQVGACRELGAEWKRENMEYISDTSAPTGDGKVFRGKFPAGMRDGGSPWRFDCWDATVAEGGSANDYSEVYISYWMKIEGSDFENQVQGVKTLYWAHGSTIRNNHSFGRLDGTFVDQAVMKEMQRTAYIYQMEDDGSDAGGGAHHEVANVADRSVQPGKWQRFELWMKINDIGPTRDNGEFKMWIDGTLTHHLTNLRWRSDQNPKGFYHLQFTPVYGGNSGNVRSRDDYWLLDDLYVSARE